MKSEKTDTLCSFYFCVQIGTILSTKVTTIEDKKAFKS